MFYRCRFRVSSIQPGFIFLFWDILEFGTFDTHQPTVADLFRFAVDIFATLDLLNNYLDPKNSACFITSFKM